VLILPTKFHPDVSKKREVKIEKKCINATASFLSLDTHSQSKPTILDVSTDLKKDVGILAQSSLFLIRKIWSPLL